MKNGRTKGSPALRVILMLPGVPSPGVTGNAIRTTPPEIALPLASVFSVMSPANQSQYRACHCARVLPFMLELGGCGGAGLWAPAVMARHKPKATAEAVTLFFNCAAKSPAAHVLILIV